MEKQTPCLIQMDEVQGETRREEFKERMSEREGWGEREREREGG